MPLTDPIPQTLTDWPVVLLPVRLETRFVRVATGTELWIRVFPVAIHTDTHEPPFTEDEVSAGTVFWSERNRQGSAEGDWRAAWSRLAGQFGQERAAWIARIFNPANTGEAGLRSARRTGWTRPPRTMVLPHRWVAVGYKITPDTPGAPRKVERIFESWGAPIRDELRVGPSPSYKVPVLPPGEFHIEPDLQWMVDFETARREGMALSVPLAAPYSQGFDRLLVLGVKQTIGATAPSSSLELARASKARLEQLLDAHHYTDGLGFVHPGTPTNNSVEEASGYASGDDVAVSYAIEVRDTAVAPVVPADSYLALAAKALGVSASTLARLRHARLDEGPASPRGSDAERLHAALWPATWGYYLEQMMAGAIQDPPPAAVMRDVRCRYIKWVRGGGPLPALRVGNEPYGLLPATALDRWEPRGGDLPTDARTTAFLRELRDKLWLTSIDKVPRIGATQEGDDHGTLVGILGMDARSSSYAARSVVGSQYADYLFGYLSGSGVNVRMDARWWTRMEQLTQYVRRTKLDVELAPRLTEALNATFHYLVRKPLVRPATPDPRLEPANYIDTLLRLAVTAIRANVSPGTTDPAQPSTLLYALLRHAALLTYTVTARAVMGTRAPAWLEPELIGLPYDIDDPDAAPPPTPWWFLDQRRDPATAVPTIGEYLAQVKEAEKNGPGSIDCSGDAVRAFVDFWQSLTYLKERPAAILEHALVDALDLSAHRLDAWITSFATQRLSAQRATATEGAYIGGYGVLVDVRPGAVAPRRRGFIHAPSASHATMAAILRSGFLSHASDAPFVAPTPGLPARITCITKRNRQSIHERIARVGGVNADGSEFQLTLDDAIAAVKRGVDFYVERPAGDRVRVIVAHSAHGFEYLRTTADGDEPNNLLALDECVPAPGGGAFAVDLSSDRVRRALRILDGVRQGQTLGALLGYRFERGLHDAGLDEFIAVFREIAPLVAGKMTLDGTPVQSLPAANVVDGLALSRLSRSAAGLPWGSRGLPNVGSDPRYAALSAQLFVLDDTMDALSDLLLAESVYHIGRGNPLRSGSTLDAIGRGDAPLPELECVRTARSGIGTTHRVAVMFSEEPVMPPGWGTTVSPRAAVEPILNAWAARLFGDPSRFACLATYVDANGQHLAGVEPLTVRVTALGLSPLDLVYIAGAEQGAQRAELEQRVAYYALHDAPVTVPAAADVLLNFGPHSQAGVLSFDALREFAGTLRTMIAAARQIATSDLVGPDAVAPPPGVDLGELTRRADQAVMALRQKHDALQPIAAATDPAQCEALRRRLVDLSYFGVEGAIPLSMRGAMPDDLRVLTRQAQSVVSEVSRRLDAVDALIGLRVATEDVNRRLTRLRDTLRQSDAAERERVERWAIAGTATDPAAGDRGAAEYQLAILREVFGAGFRVLPRLQWTGGAALATALGASDTLQAGDNYAALTWFQRVSRVREAVARLDSVLQYAEAVNPGFTRTLRVAQLPYIAGEPWVALPPAPERTIPASRVSLVVHTSGAPYTGGWLTGLHVDEFAEVVPSATEPTAVAFPTDRPGARAPQAILLAVSPYAQGRAWDLDTLAAIVHETIDLATIRTVDIDAVESVGHFLPALHFAVNTNPDATREPDTVSTDFQRLGERRP